VTVEKTQPVTPNNQINNQLNTSSSSATTEQPGNSETGEEEQKKQESTVGLPFLRARAKKTLNEFSIFIFM